MFSNDVVAIHKPVGMSSHDVVNRVRRITGERRVGHAGTLDPLASGVLIILIGRAATKRQAEFMLGEKVYEAEITFGHTSATDDAQGPLTSTASIEQLTALTEHAIATTLPQFTGVITQTPPAFSAIKIAGKTAYARAREGSLTQDMLAPRTVEVLNITLTSFVPGTSTAAPRACIAVHCHKGVYIRSLARDIGAALGVGAYMSALCRTRVGPFSLDKALTLEQFSADWQSNALSHI